MRSGPVFFLVIMNWYLPIPVQADGIAKSITGVIPDAPQSPCLSKPEAERAAQNLALSSAKNHCRGQGYGWRAASVKDLGKLNCSSCSQDGYSCAYSRVTLDCSQPPAKFGWGDLVGWRKDIVSKLQFVQLRR